MRNIILLCSGNLGEIALRYLHSTQQLTFVFTDKRSISIIDYCKENGVALFIGNPRSERAKIVIDSLKCNILLSINYLFVVGADLLSVACDYAINFHGSLLPRYRGRTPHVWAIINGEKETGITAHLMTERVDDGKIVKQISIPIEDQDTGFSILQKFNVAYLSVIVEVLGDVNRNTVNLIEQDHRKATYFGKRTPDDGEIDWNWQKERIRNWIRAQRAPYPGAFSYYEGEKIIIHEIAYSEVGFNYTDKNGLILRDRPLPIIKTPNGAVTIVQFESKTPVNFESGKFLSCLK